MQEKSRAWARDGQPGRAIPVPSLEELRSQHETQERALQQQVVYVNRLHAEIMQEEYRQRTGRPRSAQADARIARLLAEDAPASPERALDTAPERTDRPRSGEAAAAHEHHLDRDERRHERPERVPERQPQGQALAGVEAGGNGIEDDAPGHGATFRIRDKERDFGHSR